MEAKPSEALAEFKRLSGIMKQDMPEVMKNVGGLFQAALPAGALPAKEKALIGLGISVGIHCETCILVFMEKCLAAGATRAEILEACGVAVSLGGGPATAYVARVLKVLEEQR
jgi:AhpD family alkylhydroperoxidase